MPAVRTHACRHRGAAGEPIGGKAHNSYLLEAALFIHGQQFDLHAAVLQRGHQDQVLIAAAGDILHQILLVLLLQDRGKHAVGVGIHSQIMVALCRCITHHQLGGIAGCSWASPTDSTVSARPSTFWRTCQMSASSFCRMAMHTLELWAVV